VDIPKVVNFDVGLWIESYCSKEDVLKVYRLDKKENNHILRTPDIDDFKINGKRKYKGGWRWISKSLRLVKLVGKVVNYGCEKMKEISGERVACLQREAENAIIMMMYAKHLKWWQVKQILFELIDTVKYEKKEKKGNVDILHEYTNFTANVGELLRLENWTGLLSMEKNTKWLNDREVR
jgi:hypothetical protein